MVIAGSLITSIFVLIVSVTSLYVQNIIYEGDVCSCFIPISILIPIIASIGLLIGVVVYYLFSPKFEKKIDRNIVLRLFDSTEAEIINHLLNNSGEATQASIVKSTNIPKVKVFRTIERLKRKEILEKKPRGKTNTITLRKEIVNILK